MKICILGANGNMGRRYQAILNREQCDFDAFDFKDHFPNPNDYTHIIVTTPTHLHLSHLSQINAMADKPVNILCEKPIYKIDTQAKKDEFYRLLNKLQSNGHKLNMVNQYAYYLDNINESIAYGETFYDYYNSGGDGIGWDCIQLIHLAQKEVYFLRNISPVWFSSINGHPLSRREIDLCYVKMIKDFLNDGGVYGRLWGYKDISEAHEKVGEYYERCNNRDTGAEHF